MNGVRGGRIDGAFGSLRRGLARGGRGRGNRAWRARGRRARGRRCVRSRRKSGGRPASWWRHVTRAFFAACSDVRCAGDHTRRLVVGRCAGLAVHCSMTDSLRLSLRLSLILSLGLGLSRCCQAKHGVKGRRIRSLARSVRVGPPGIRTGRRTPGCGHCRIRCGEFCAWDHHRHGQIIPLTWHTMRAVSVKWVASIMPASMRTKSLKSQVNIWVRQVNDNLGPADCARWWVEAAGQRCRARLTDEGQVSVRSIPDLDPWHRLGPSLAVNPVGRPSGPDARKTRIRMNIEAKTGCCMSILVTGPGVPAPFWLGKPCRSVGSFDRPGFMSCDVSRMLSCR